MTRKALAGVELTDPQWRVLAEIGHGTIERLAGPDGWVYRRGGATMDRTEIAVLNRLLDVQPPLVATPDRSLYGPTSGPLRLTEAGRALLQPEAGPER